MNLEREDSNTTQAINVSTRTEEIAVGTDTEIIFKPEVLKEIEDLKE